MKLGWAPDLGDALGNLYRAAFFLARSEGQETIAFELIKKSQKVLEKETFLKSTVDKLDYLLEDLVALKSNQRKRKIIAEKILDQYLVLKSFYV